MSEINKIDFIPINGGVSSDISPELLNTQQGLIYDAENMRSGRNYGYGNGRVKIGGELLIYDTYIYPNASTAQMTGFECIGFTNCKNYLVAFWTNDAVTRVTVDNKIVCESNEVGLTIDHPLQLDTNESCVGGEVFTTDDNTVPMIWSLKDLVDAWTNNQDTYFSGFNISFVSVALETQHDKPMFRELEAIGSQDGLLSGSYAYAMRYVDASGNRTKHSAFTPLIPVISQYATGSSQYNNALTIGGIPANYSRYGIKLNYRVTNINNYSYVELVRISYNSADVLGTQPTVKYYQIPNPLSEGQISVQEFVDIRAIEDEWITLTPEEQTLVLLTIKSAKSIRYYENRLELGNIKYVGKDTTFSLMEESSGNKKVYPYIQAMGKDGHANPFNTTMYKGYLGGEKYKIGVEYVDNNNETTFVDNAEDVTYPLRRSRLAAASKTLSVDLGDGAVRTSDVYNVDNQYTHETYEQGTTHKLKLSSNPNGFTVREDDYYPITPTDQADTAQKGHQYCVMEELFVDPTSSTSVAAEKCSVFGENYFAGGMALHGVEGLLSSPYIKSFNIVRTEPLNRVKSQGLITYAFNGDGFTKYLNRVWYFSNDIASGIAAVPQSGQYIQCVAPVGFSSEIYNAFNNNADFFDTINLDADTRGIDMITHATIQNNKPTIQVGTTNAGLTKAGLTISDNYKTLFGEWRNDIAVVANNPFYDGSSGVNAELKTFKIASVTPKPVSDAYGNYYFYELEIDGDDIYLDATCPPLALSANDAQVQSYHEPFYVANIISEGADFTTNNSDTYIQTGYSQKVKSIIGDTDSGVEQYELIDERFEDCIPYPNAADRAQYTNFITIVDKTTLAEKKWINATYLDPATIALIQAGISAVGYYDIAPYPIMSGISTVRVYGLYTHIYNGANNGYFSVIDFSTYGKPAGNQRIVVEYDNRFPFKFFGGDVITTINVGAAYEGKNDSNGDPVDGREFNFGGTGYCLCFPYPKFKFYDNSVYGRIKNADPDLVKPYFQSTDTYKMGKLRQLVYEWIGETRIHYQYGYNAGTIQNYPRVHYIMNPEKWDLTEADNFGTSSIGIERVSTLYQTDYVGRFAAWGYGGFQYKQLYDIDYSKSNNYDINISKPVVGFKEETDFCSQIIWSNIRNIGQQDTPNLKTFPAINIYNLPDAYGEIKYLFDAESSKGHNLYAFTENGVCLVLTNKTLISEATGSQLTVIPVGDNLINGHLWLRTDIGMNDEMWRSAAEWAKSIVWANSDSVYYLFDNTVQDVGRNGYYNKLYTTCLSGIKDGYNTKISAVYDMFHKEYWLTQQYGVENLYLIDLLNGNTSYDLGTYDDGVIGYVVENNDVLNILQLDPLTPYVNLPSGFTVGEMVGIINNSGQTLYVYGDNAFNVAIPNGSSSYFSRDLSASFGWDVLDSSPIIPSYALDLGTEQPQWNGTYLYEYDKYTGLANSVYGIRNGKIYKLNEGYSYNNEDITSSIKVVSNKEAIFDKEFISVAVGSYEKPTEVAFSTDKNIESEAALYANMSVPPNTIYLKNYGGKWTNKIPRKLQVGRPRMQGKYLIINIRHTGSQFNLSELTINYKSLKLQM